MKVIDFKGKQEEQTSIVVAITCTQDPNLQAIFNWANWPSLQSPKCGKCFIKLNNLWENKSGLNMLSKGPMSQTFAREWFPITTTAQQIRQTSY